MCSVIAKKALASHRVLIRLCLQFEVLNRVGSIQVLDGLKSVINKNQRDYKIIFCLYLHLSMVEVIFITKSTSECFAAQSCFMPEIWLSAGQTLLLLVMNKDFIQLLRSFVFLNTKLGIISNETIRGVINYEKECQYHFHLVFLQNNNKVYCVKP